MVAWIMAGSAVAGGVALGLGGLLTRRLLRYRESHATQEPFPSAAEPTPESVLEIKMERYQPMARLFGDDDLRFLASRPGYRPEMAARLRRSRRRIFRMYLAELSADFHRLHAAARRLVANAPEQHADMVGVLMRQQVTFWGALFAIEVRLALDWAGIGTADARRLLELVQQLQQAVAGAQPFSQALPA